MIPKRLKIKIWDDDRLIQEIKENNEKTAKKKLDGFFRKLM